MTSDRRQHLAATWGEAGLAETVDGAAPAGAVQKGLKPAPVLPRRPQDASNPCFPVHAKDPARDAEKADALEGVRGGTLDPKARIGVVPVPNIAGGQPA